MLFGYVEKQSVLDYTLQEVTNRRLQENVALQNILQNQIWNEGKFVHFSPDFERIKRILLKLAKGHAGFELDYVNFDDKETNIWHDFDFNMSVNDINEFKNIPTYQLCPEIGSRGMNLIVDLNTNDTLAFSDWDIVQKDQYRYQVSYDDNYNVVVKIVIFEFLFCKIKFSQ